jgi:K+-sensing histidine kinase KdpD
MARSPRKLEIDGEGAFWAVAGFAASILVGVALRPLRESAGLENVVVVYVIVVALTAAVGGRAAGLASSLSAALAYNWFFTTPYGTLQIDSAEQVATVVLLFVAGLLASLGGRATRRARVEAREEADVLQVLTAVNLAAARTGLKADAVAADGLRDLLDARAVRVVREGRRATWWSPRPARSTATSTWTACPTWTRRAGSPPATGARSAAPWSSRSRAPWSIWSAATAASAPW